MDPPLCFASLPNEMVTQICEHPDLDKSDLTSLRLTSKAHGIYDAATKALGRYFANTTVLFTRHSFRTLVNVCEHPIFSGSIQRIMLSSIRCRNDMNHRDIIDALLAESEESEEDPYEELDLEAGEYWEEDSEEDRATQLQALYDFSVKMRSYVSRARSEAAFYKSESVKLLVRAFQSLAHLDTSVALGVTNDEHHSLGCSKIFCAENAKEEGLWHNQLLDTTNIMATALFQSKLVVSKVDVETCHSLACWRTGPRGLLEEQNIETNTIFSRLKALSLHLDSFANCHDRGIMLPFSAVLTQSTHLKSLRLESGESPHPDDDNLSVERLFASVSSINLGELCLSKLEVTEAGMRQLLIKTSTLKSLSILDCHMRETSWIPTITRIKNSLSRLEDLQLRHLVLCESRIGDWTRPMLVKKHEAKLLSLISAHGYPDIQSSLEEVLESYEIFAHRKPVVTFGDEDR